MLRWRNEWQATGWIDTALTGEQRSSTAAVRVAEHKVCYLQILALRGFCHHALLWLDTIRPLAVVNTLWRLERSTCRVFDPVA